MARNYEWHRHYHARALASYANMSAEQRGVAYTLLDLMYDRQCPLNENSRILGARCNMGKVRFERVRDELISLGKFRYTEEGHLTNSFVQDELEKVNTLARKNAENGKKGGQKKSGKSGKGNENSGNSKRPPSDRLSRDSELESFSPQGLKTPLPDIAMTALEGLQSHVVNHRDWRILIGDIVGWREGVFLLKSQWAIDELRLNLGRALKAEGLSVERITDQAKLKVVESEKSQ
jgi:uncharacterized protein YdaU (DUF1376 family)